MSVDPGATGPPLVAKHADLEAEFQRAKLTMSAVFGEQVLADLIADANRIYCAPPTRDERLTAINAFRVELQSRFGVEDPRHRLVSAMTMALAIYTIERQTVDRWLDGVDLPHWDGPMPDEDL